MPRVLLQSDVIGALSDGSVGRMLDAEIERAWKDLEERGEDGKKRSVKIQLDLTPARDGFVEIGVSVKADIPPNRSLATLGKIDNRAGGLLFKTDSAKNPDQLTFEDLPEKGD